MIKERNNNDDDVINLVLEDDANFNHDFFNTWADNSIDVMDHWTSGLAWWANDLIEDFYDDPFPVDWNVKLVMSI